MPKRKDYSINKPIKRPSTKLVGTGTARQAAEKSKSWRKQSEEALKYK